MKRVCLVLCSAILILYGNAGAAEVTFEDLPLALESYYNGSDGAGGFSSGGAHFNNYYDDTYGPYWEGFSYSNTTDTTMNSYTNDSSAIVGSGKDNSTIYGVGYQGFMGSIPTATFQNEGPVTGCYITNTTYANLAMRDGNSPAKIFGGDTGADPDWFLLTITGKDAGGNETGTVEFYLADFRFDDSADDYIVDEWTPVVLSSLGDVKSLEFTLSSSDNGQYGMNTPAYFAIDNINDQDDDGDGYSEVEGDCDDGNMDVNPDETEMTYNGLDDDCDPATRDDDLDEDGFTAADECNDDDSSIHPNATEVCGDGIDQDCSGSDLSCEDDDDNWLEGCFINVIEGAIE